MKIVIATPLYPPDIAEPAPYVKELAARLAPHHSVTVVCYGSIPEQVAGVQIRAVPKNRPAPIRILLYTLALLAATRDADMVYAQAGSSVELPLSILWRLTRVPYIFRTDNVVVDTEIKKSALRSGARQSVMKYAAHIVKGVHLDKPEINPLEARPEAALSAYEAQWATHLNVLEGMFSKPHG